MKPNQSGTIRRKSKPKLDIIALIVIFILGGIILMIIPFMIEEDSETGSKSIIDGSFGITRILNPGDKLEIEYSMSGEESVVYLTKDGESLFLTKDDMWRVTYLLNKPDRLLWFINSLCSTRYFSFPITFRWLGLSD